MTRFASSNSIISALLALVLIGIAPHAIGQVFPAYGTAVSGVTDNTACSQSPSDCFNTTSSSLASGSLSSSATGAISSSTAEANLTAGYLSVSAVSGREPFYSGASANALIWDTLTFSGVTTGATATIVMQGSSSGLTGGSVSGGSALISPVVMASLGLQPTYLLHNGLYAQDFPTTAVGSYTYRNTVPITNGQLVLFIGLGTSAGIWSCAPQCLYGQPGSSYINDPYFLELPTGVTYTSAFQQSAPVPEPETYAMMLAGLGMMGFMVRRRKQA
jgi:hypothetical protein